MAVDFARYGLKAGAAAPTPRQVEWYTRERTAFFHFGMNTFKDQEWGDGTDDPADFNPPEIDCRQWARAAREAGFTVGILTAKHHDGFCLWPTETTDYNVSRSPYKGGKGDVVAEFAAACREYGLRVGLYLSPWDRHEPCWGTEAYNELYARQLIELMSRYGPIAECWWDGAGSEKAHYDWGRWACIVRDLQPGCILFGSTTLAPCVDTRWVGNEGGFAGNPCWATVPGGPGAGVDRFILNHGDAKGNCFIPAECDVSIRPGWFYHSNQDSEVKSPSRLVTYWFDSVGKNSGMLLNLPPMPNGKLHQTDVDNCREAYRLIRTVFAFNLAAGAAVQATSTRPGCAADRLLLEDLERFYAAAEGDCTPTLTFTLPRPQTVNCFRLGEMIELGHRVRKYAVDVRVDGAWRTIFEGESIGYLWADRFETVTTDGLRLRILQADEAPVLREFGVYFLSDDVFAEEKALRQQENLAQKPGAKITREGSVTTVNLGGIYPYNRVIFDSLGAFSYRIEAFNGTTWDAVAAGRPGSREIVRLHTVDGSYQLRITLGDGAADGDIHPEVYYQST